MHEVTLESLAFGGDAVGRINGKVVFVPLGAPGDRVRLRLLKQTATYSSGEIIEVLEPGPGRREPPCPHFGVCGGCQWQHIAYDVQAAAKAEVFEAALSEAEAEQLVPLARAPQELGYRRRVRWHFAARGGHVVLGYFRRRSQDLLEIGRCPLLVDPLRLAMERCREAMGVLGTARGTVVALAGGEGEVHLSIRLERGERDDLEALAERELGAPVVGGLVQHGDQERSFGAASVNLMLPEEPPLAGSAGAFAQASADQDHLLRRRVSSWAGAGEGRVLELFAGVGNLTRDLAADGGEVVAVESSPASAELLLQNAESLPGSVTVLAQDAEEAVLNLISRRERFDVVVLDPPREGCARVTALLPELGARRIVYVSCDPMTLARDLVRLVEHARGYRVERAGAIDMMPQTYHVEGVALLHKR
jgi:23S rRNA (uracil1939-C5)-methyltransferase